jgi:hypothetical protein
MTRNSSEHSRKVVFGSTMMVFYVDIDGALSTDRAAYYIAARVNRRPLRELTSGANFLF